MSNPQKRILVTGGAGFVGGTLSIELARRHPEWRIVAFDNLRRPGSELNVPRLKDAGVELVRGDVREPADLQAIAPIDALVECSAEPSALAGVDGSTGYVFHTNLVGAYNCLELARRDGAQFVFLSTSRVYPVATLERLAFEEGDTRFALAPQQPVAGASPAGIAEDFPLAGARTLYGATKLAAEHLVAEYEASFGLATVVDRCGVIAGPWQMGKVDQGVFTHWVLSHYAGRPLRYIGFGGTGKQVRDLLHVDDLVDLIDEQLGAPERWRGTTVNVGGGADHSLSLLETTELCRQVTGRRVDVTAAGEDRPGDVRVYISDCARLHGLTEWRPRRGPELIIEDIARWVRDHGQSVMAALP
jgi:CDP-paratose 2-epimerase